MKKKIILMCLTLFVLTGCASDKNIPEEEPNTVEKESTTPTELPDSMPQNPDVSEMDVSETDISETDTSEINISETDISETNANETDVSETNTNETNISEANANETDVSETDVNETEEKGIDLDTVKWINDYSYLYIYSEEYADAIASGHYASHMEPDQVARDFATSLLLEGKLQDIGDSEIISEQDDERIYQFYQKDSGITTLVCINSYVVSNTKIWYADKYSIIE